MRQILLRTTLFLLPILLLLGGLEYVQKELPNDYAFKKANFEAGLDQWEVLILGSSHSYLGIDPHHIARPTFNLAYTAQTLAFDQFLLEKYIDQLTKLKFIVLPISYPTYGSESYLYPGIYNKTYYYHHYYGSNLFTKWYEPENYSLLALLTVKRAVDQTSQYYKGEGDALVECDNTGWYGPTVTRDLEENGRKSAGFHDLFYDTELYEANEQYLTEMIQLCKSKGIEPILVSTPMWHTYLSGLNPDRLQHMVQTTDAIARKHQVLYLNHMDDPLYRSSDFFDANHLSPSGAEKFSKYLNSIMQSLENGQLAAHAQPFDIQP